MNISGIDRAIFPFPVAHCEVCAETLWRTVTSLPGVRGVKRDREGSVTVEFDARLLDRGDLESAVEAAGARPAGVTA